MKAPWFGHVDPFRIYGNLYFVGTVPASSHLIDTGDGLILIDSGYPQRLHLVLESIWELGFDPRKIRYIVHSHGHYDHLGATRSLVELTGAKTFLGRDDADYANGKVNLTLADFLGYQYSEFEFFEPDVLLDDNSRIILGNTEIRCVHTPGHSPGVMSFFFDAHGPQGDLRAGMFGGSGLFTMQKKFLEAHHLPADLPTAYQNSLTRLKQEHVDIHIGNHVDDNDTVGKGKRVLAGDINACINPAEWDKFLIWKQGLFDKMRADDV